jgi:glycogen synthase
MWLRAGLASSGNAPTDMQLAVLGTGTRWMEAALSGLSQSYPGKAAGIPSFSESLAHLLLAAADYVVVPSRFEPCGLVAQCGVRYGAVPVVASVGGLRDLVTSQVSSPTLSVPAPMRAAYCMS